MPSGGRVGAPAHAQALADASDLESRCAGASEQALRDAETTREEREQRLLAHQGAGAIAPCIALRALDTWPAWSAGVLGVCRVVCECELLCVLCVSTRMGL